MKKKFLHSLVAALLFVCLMSFTACSSNSVADYLVVEKLISMWYVSGNSFTYTIEVEMQENFTYKGSSSYESLAEVSIYTEIDGVTYTLKSEPAKANADYEKVKLQRGQRFKVVREFEAVVWDEEAGDYVPAPEGFYRAKIEFFGREFTLGEGGIVIYEETESM